ncbi:MAG: alpha/beta hydrolase [Cyanobacteriota bacterium]
MIWFWQAFKLLKLFISFIKAIKKILDRSDDSDNDLKIEDKITSAKDNKEVVENLADTKIEKPVKTKKKSKPEKIEANIELVGPPEEPNLPPKKDSDPLSFAIGLLGFTAGFIGTVYIINKFFIPKYSKVPKALTGELKYIKVDEGLIAYYKDGNGPPMILLHGINPGASSHEMEVIFNHYRLNRTVYSIDLLGFGQSERPDIEYTPELYIRHISELLNHTKLLHDCKPDVIALGLTTEYIVAIAEKAPELFNKIILISPTGLEKAISKTRCACCKIAVNLFKLPVLGQGLFNLITSKTFLKKYLSSRIFAEPRNLSYLMLQQYYHTTHVDGAKNAPAFYVAGELVIENLFQKYLNLKVPSLVIAGTGSEAYSSYEALSPLTKDNKYIIQKVIDNGGLLSYIEKPDDFFNATNKFLS